jgi:hypothetical protein
MQHHLSPVAHPAASLSRSRPVAVALLVSSSVACIPQSDLSSYSDTPASDNGAELQEPPSTGSDAGTSRQRDNAGDRIDAAGGPVGLVDGPEETDLSLPLGAPARQSVPVGAPDATAQAPEGACDAPGEFPNPNGGCYLFSDDPTTWPEALQRCAAWSGTLVRVNAPEESALLAEHLTANAWIGLSDREAEGVMRWDDGAPLTDYANWAAQQPDDFAGNEDCIETLPGGGGWNDRPCTDLRAYVCER